MARNVVAVISAATVGRVLRHDVIRPWRHRSWIFPRDPDDGGPEFTFDEAVSLLINCADQEEVDHYWTKLSDGGEEGPCGWLKDRYGLSWQVIPVALGELLSDPDEDRARRAMKAMLGMKKIDVAAIQAAADQA